MNQPIAPPERVLPTLNADGSRKRVRPELFKGRTYRARLVVAWGLLVLFVSLPLLTLRGKPLVLLDVAQREFTLFGRTFLPTDGALLMLLLLAIFVAIFWITALVGRAWCGWACPQTVYLEFVFRPIERWIEGPRPRQLRMDREGGGWRRAAKNLTFLALSLFVANVFLAYFVGVAALSRWITQSPFQHPGPFLVVAATTGLVFFDFAYFREQMCTVACPYARLQSVLLDSRSLIVGYDGRRGEPRVKGKPKPGAGDCIDCGACTRACPTGIDIRQGLQLECIACAQCIDACDSIMTKVHKPLGLIRYATQRGLENADTRGRRFGPRALLYPAVFLAIVAALMLYGQPQAAEVTVLRGLGAPYVLADNGVRNQLRIKIENRTSRAQEYSIALVDDAELSLVAPENPLLVQAGEHRTTTVFVSAPRRAFSDGVKPIRFSIKDRSDFAAIVDYRLVGPKDLSKPAHALASGVDS